MCICFEVNGITCMFIRFGGLRPWNIGGHLASRQAGLEGAWRNDLPSVRLVILMAFLADFFFFLWLLLKTSGDRDSTAFPGSIPLLHYCYYYKCFSRKSDLHLSCCKLNLLMFGLSSLQEHWARQSSTRLRVLTLPSQELLSKVPNISKPFL